MSELFHVMPRWYKMLLIAIVLILALDVFVLAPAAAEAGGGPITHFIGYVQMEGRGSSPSERWIVAMNVQIHGPTTKRFFVLTDENGRFEVAGEEIPPGRYTIQVRGSHTLGTMTSAVLGATPPKINFGVLREGDLNGDGQINLTDYTMLAKNFGQYGYVKIPGPTAPPTPTATRTSTPTPTSTPVATVTSTPTSTSTATPTPTSTPTAMAFTIDMSGVRFEPYLRGPDGKFVQKLQVRKGDHIRVGMKVAGLTGQHTVNVIISGPPGATTLQPYPDVGWGLSWPQGTSTVNFVGNVPNWRDDPANYAEVGYIVQGIGTFNVPISYKVDGGVQPTYYMEVKVN